MSKADLRKIFKAKRTLLSEDEVKTRSQQINENFLQNTNRCSYISTTLFILLATIACYRVIFNIDILNYFNLLKI